MVYNIRWITSGIQYKVHNMVSLISVLTFLDGWDTNSHPLLGLEFYCSSIYGSLKRRWNQSRQLIRQNIISLVAPLI